MKALPPATRVSVMASFADGVAPCAVVYNRLKHAVAHA